MSQDNTTPRPWAVRPTSIDGQAILEGGNPPFEGFSVQFSKVDAELIAKSINMHDELVSALKDVVAGLKNGFFKDASVETHINYRWELEKLLEKAGK